MKVRLDVTGTEEIRRALAEGGPVVREAAKGVLDEAADAIVSLAGPLTPVEPVEGGDLKSTVRKGRPFDAKSGLLSIAIIAGGNMLAQEGHVYNIYAALQEIDVGRGAPFHHTTGRAHFILEPAEMVGPTIPDRVLEAIKPEMLGGA